MRIRRPPAPPAIRGAAGAPGASGASAALRRLLLFMQSLACCTRAWMTSALAPDWLRHHNVVGMGGWDVLEPSSTFVKDEGGL